MQKQKSMTKSKSNLNASIWQNKQSIKWKVNLLNGKNKWKPYFHLGAYNQNTFKKPQKKCHDKPNNSMYRWVKEIDFFPKKDLQMANTHMKMCSTWLNISTKQIKTTIIIYWWYYLTTVRMAIIKKPRDKHWWQCEEKGTSELLVGI